MTVECPVCRGCGELNIATRAANVLAAMPDRWITIRALVPIVDVEANNLTGILKGMQILGLVEMRQRAAMEFRPLHRVKPVEVKPKRAKRETQAFVPKWQIEMNDRELYWPE